MFKKYGYDISSHQKCIYVTVKGNCPARTFLMNNQSGWLLYPKITIENYFLGR